MSIRRAGSLAAAFALAACTNVSQTTPPSTLVIATFDPTTSTIPLPNDLALQAAPSLPAGAQQQLLQAFATAGGFPDDQEVAITIPLRTLTYDAATRLYTTGTPPTVDLTTVTASTVTIQPLNAAAGAAPIAFDAVATPGLLTLRVKAAADGSRHWKPGGRYAVAVRGGANGVKTTGGLPIAPDEPIALVAPDVTLLDKEHQPPGFTAAQAAAAEGLRLLYATPLSWCVLGGAWNPPLPPAPATACGAAPASSAFAAVSTAFPSTEIASIQTFGVEGGTHVAGDPGAGQIPLPSDFLLDPTTGLVQNLPAFGAAAPGLATLDGFSTTGMMVAQTTAPVDATTISRGSVLLFDLGPVAAPSPAPTYLNDVASALGAGTPAAAAYLTEPPQIVETVGAAQLSTAIGLQPAVPVPTGTAAGTLYLPPLGEHHRYAVVVTDRVKDAAGRPLTRGTLGDLLFTVTGSLVDGSGHSTVVGVSDANAAGLQALKTGLAPLLAGLPTLTGDATLTADHVVMAYTVTTQSFLQVAAQLPAIPYQIEAATNTAIFTATTAPVGFDTNATFGIPMAAFPDVQAFLSVPVNTFFALDPATGAFVSNLGSLPTWSPNQVLADIQQPINTLLAVPKAVGGVTCSATTPCPPSPLVVFHHGLDGSHYQMLPVADALAAHGFVVIATDAPFHGDRAYCEQNSDCVTATGGPGTCTPQTLPAPAPAGTPNQVAPALCGAGETLSLSTDLSTQASGNYFISANFFRIRDVIRQDLIDQSALVLAAARPPVGMPQPTANGIALALGGLGVTVDPTRVYFAGISLGGIIGTDIVATNPRFSRAVLNVPGGTLTDVFTTSPAFQVRVDALFATLIPGFTPQAIDPTNAAFDPAIAAQYLQTLVVAKWILDPADPINFAGHVATKAADPTFAGLLGPLGSATTAALGQYILDDGVVPNPYNLLLLTNTGAPPIPFTEYVSASLSTPANGGSAHGVLLDTFSSASVGAQERTDLAAFLDTLVTPAATVAIP